MTANELHAGMIENGMINKYYTVATLSYAFKISSQKMTAMLAELISAGKVFVGAGKNGKNRYVFVKGE